MHRNQRIERDLLRRRWTAAAGIVWLAVLVWLIVRDAFF